MVVNTIIKYFYFFRIDTIVRQSTDGVHDR